MTDSSAARILKLENLLISQGISLPSAHVKADDAASDVSDEGRSPQPTQSGTRAEMTGTKALAKVKASVKKGNHRLGRQPRLDRARRALCRIMRGHGKTHQDIANVVGQSTWTVAKAIGNDYARPDDIGADYDFVDAETKKEYPPKRAREEGGEKPPAKQQKRNTSPTRSATSRVTVDIPYYRESGEQGSKQGKNSVLEFLRDLGLEALHPKFQEAGVDNEFLVEFQHWTEKAAGELLDDFVNVGIMNRVQAFKIRKALGRT